MLVDFRSRERLRQHLSVTRRLETLGMKDHHKSWLQLHVDAMTERDPYKRLSLVRELRRIPKQVESDEFLNSVIEDSTIRQPKRNAPKSRKTKKAPRRSHRSGV